MGRGVWVPAQGRDDGGVCCYTIIQNAPSHSRGAMRPSFARNFPPSQTEGAGKTGCALHPRSRVRFALSRLHTSIQGSGEHPAFPAQRLYGLCRALPGDEFLVDSVAAGQLLTVRQLDACHGRQDHTLLPYASAALRLRSLSVHRSPPNVRDDGRRPSDQGGMGKNEPLIWPSDKAKYFLFWGLTLFP